MFVQNANSSCGFAAGLRRFVDVSLVIQQLTQMKFKPGMVRQ
jgi:hypothetical protein